ncbi:MAG: hypothetical protein K2X82_11340 [Gemmataceae bacterium]|nr:hypothetical protein [Gemmataceae bacterium]
MALEHRGGRVYRYTTERVGGRVVRRYGGSGRVAALGQQLADGTRELRRLDRLGERLRVDRLEHQNARLRGWLAGVSAAVADALRAAGWHQHRREWRRKRGAVMGPLATVPTADQVRATWFPPDLWAMAGELDPAVREKGAKGDKAVAPAVAAFVDGNPAAAALWGDVGRRVLQRWVDSYAGDCLTTRRAVWRVASDLRAGLAGPSPSFLDGLLAERVVLGWVFLAWCESQYARRLAEQTYREAEFHHKRIEMAHRNLMSACRTLAKVKKAKLPDVLALVNVNPPAADGLVPSAGA